MADIECKEVIITKVVRRGSGKTLLSLIRQITMVNEKDGEFIAEYDPSPETMEYGKAIEFARWCIATNLPPSVTSLDDFFTKQNNQ